MGTFGFTGPFSGSWSYYSNEGQIGGDFPVPENGRLTHLRLFIQGGPVTLCAWRGDSPIAEVACPGPGTDGWCEADIPVASQPQIAAGETLRLGGARSQTAGYYNWQTGAGGTWYSVDSPTPTGWGGATAQAGTIGASADYTTGSRISFDGSMSFGRLVINGVQSGRVIGDGVTFAWRHLTGALARWGSWTRASRSQRRRASLQPQL